MMRRMIAATHRADEFISRDPLGHTWTLLTLLGYITLMTVKTKIQAGLTVALLATTLVGCGAQYTATGTGVTGIDVKLPDGRTVTCVVASGGGADCDWDGAR